MSTTVGHERVVSFLEKSAVNGRPAHAYLFTGTEGIGKKRVALQLARLLNCPDAEKDRDGTCSVCRRITSGNHPDVIVESPERNIIRIERIRSLRNFFRYAPVEARFRVAVLDDAHTMNKASQNALLKTLEEPPAGSILILVTANPFLLLPTVRSRCRRVRFSPIPVDALAELLSRDKGIPDLKAQALAAMSCGSVARALDLNASDYLELRDKVISFLERPGSAGVAGLLEFSAELASDGERIRDAIEVAVTWVRDLLVTKIGPDASSLVHRDSLDRIAVAAQHQSAEQLILVYEELAKAAALLEADINVNGNLVVDRMFLKITHALAGPSFGLTSAG
jgi:DNA polymerase III subunit delta'